MLCFAVFVRRGFLRVDSVLHLSHTVDAARGDGDNDGSNDRDWPYVLSRRHRKRTYLELSPCGRGGARDADPVVSPGYHGDGTDKVAAVATVDSLLETAALCKNFGGLHAVKNVDLSLAHGEIRAIIGPNGAGKTTLVNMISGRMSPTSGKIRFKGRDITGLKAWGRVFRGIVYTFQVTSIFKNLTCYENVALAAQRRLMRGVTNRFVLSESQIAERVEAALLQVGLSATGDQRADTLPYGHQRLLEVAMALALDPKLLILDEPLQGLAEEEISTFCDLLRMISQDLTVLLIEHNVSVVLELAEMITVMDGGEIIAEGSPAEIERNREVQKAYLGK